MRQSLVFILSLSCLIFLFAPCHAEDSTSIFYSGEVSFDLSDTYNAGDTISTEIHAINSEPFPIADAYLVIDIVKGESAPVYPSQESDTENVIHEEKITGINLDSVSETIVAYTYNLPSDLQSGTYRMDVYLRTEKTPIVGIPHIFLSGRYKAFTVKGSALAPEINILRTKTNIEGYTGPVGAPVEPSSEVTGTVYIEKTSSSSSSETLMLTVCRWDDTNGNSCTISNTYPVAQSSGTHAIPVSFTAPKDPDAYAIRLEVVGPDGLTESLYRSRLIVIGETSKIRKLYPDKKYYSSGETVTISALVSGSPDHYTRPEVSGATLGITVTGQTGSEIFSNEQPLPEFTSTSVFSDQSFEFIAPSTLDKFEICAEILSSENTIYDSYCIDYDSSEFKSASREYSLNDKVYHSDISIFSSDICIMDYSGMPVSTKIHLYAIESGTGTILVSDDVSVGGCYGFGFIASPGAEYKVIVNDYETGATEDFTLTPSDYVISQYPSDEPDKKDMIPGTLTLISIFVVIIALIMFTIRKRRD